MNSDSARFPLFTDGAVRHWWTTLPFVVPYVGPPGSDDLLRENVLPDPPGEAPPPAVFGMPGPSGTPWTFHDAGRNVFIEFSDFHHRTSRVEVWAETLLTAECAGELSVRFWVAGAADLWVNGEWIHRLKVTRYHQSPDSVRLRLPLMAGENRIQVRLQAMGLRDTRIAFGLFREGGVDIGIVLKGAGAFGEMQAWLDTVRPAGRSLVASKSPAPAGVQVTGRDGIPLDWQAGDADFVFRNSCPDIFRVSALVGGVEMARNFELPGNCPGPEALTDRKAALLRPAAAICNPPVHVSPFPVLARRLLGQQAPEDAALFRISLSWVDRRLDCADFHLAALLRMELLNMLSPEESEALRETCLGFRYGEEEAGSDAMCFNSENHSLLFRGCQLLAGNLYPEENFVASGRKGDAQAEVARGKIRAWLNEIEAQGFREHNSSSYIVITVGAMLNVLDFGGDAELSARMQRLIDGVLLDLARHTFAGGIITPQGRVYRDVLYPEAAASLHLLASVVESVPVSNPQPPHLMSGCGLWTPFLMSSSKYSPPAHLEKVCREPVSRVSLHGGMEIHLRKTEAYLLTSVALPGTEFAEEVAEEFRPGQFGYQQHLWQATLGRGCHVFVNHPGGNFDGTRSRPGYWYGNGVMPRVRQEGNWLQTIHMIPDGSEETALLQNPNPVQFTHAHWPSEAFDEERAEAGWHFGRCGRGLVGLWCSVALQPHDEVLTGRELRARGAVSAWLTICGDLNEYGSLENFARECKDRAPYLEKASLTLYMNGAEPTSWMVS